MGKKIYIYGPSNPFNSINIQVKQLSKIIFELYDIEPILLNSEMPDIKTKLKEVSKSNDLIFWQYGSLDTSLFYLHNLNIVLVFHNITPPKYFLKTDPLVSVRSMLGYMQLFLLRLRNKNLRWIAQSDYNRNVLRKIGFRNIIICPSIIFAKGKEIIPKSENFSLLYVGRIVENKNCITLLKQIKKASDYLRVPVEFTIVGSAKKRSLYGKIFNLKYRKLMSNLNIKPIWMNKIDETCLSNLYKKSWLYISLSLHEGVGAPACESIMAGTPAIYLQCGGQECVLDNLGMVLKKNEKNFYKYIIEMLSDNDKRNELLIQQQGIVKSYTLPYIKEYIKASYGRYIERNR